MQNTPGLLVPEFLLFNMDEYPQFAILKEKICRLKDMSASLPYIRIALYSFLRMIYGYYQAKADELNASRQVSVK